MSRFSTNHWRLACNLLFSFIATFPNVWNWQTQRVGPRRDSTAWAMTDSAFARNLCVTSAEFTSQCPLQWHESGWFLQPGHSGTPLSNGRSRDRGGLNLQVTEIANAP